MSAGMSTINTVLKAGTTASALTQLCKIKSYPQLGGEPESIETSGGASGVSFLVAKLPSAICPKNTIKSQAWTANGAGQRHGASIEIKPNGQIYLVAGDSFVEAGFTVSYPL